MLTPLSDIVDRWNAEQLAAMDAGTFFLRELVVEADGTFREETDAEFRARIKLALYGKSKEKRKGAASIP